MPFRKKKHYLCKKNKGNYILFDPEGKINTFGPYLYVILYN